jgi:hypothetical protein
LKSFAPSFAFERSSPHGRTWPKRLDDLERRYDRQFKSVFDAIRALMESDPDPPRGKIGFKP